MWRWLRRPVVSLSGDSENPYGNAPGRVSHPFRDPEVRTITIRERAGVFGADARGRR